MAKDGSYTAGYNATVSGVNSAGSADPTLLDAALEAPRVSDAEAALAMYRKAKKDDDSSAANRALVQDMVDGVPPFKQSALKAAGRPGAANINFQEGAALVEAGTTAYNNLIDGVDVLARGVMTPGVYEPPEAVEYAEAIADEISSLVRSHPEFSFNWENISRQVTTHGVGIGYFPEDDGSDWTSGGLDDFLIPRQTRATEEAVDTLYALKKTPISDIWQKIQDEEAATALGWNVGVAKMAMVNASEGKSVSSWASDWKSLQNRLKNNDQGIDGVAALVPVVHMWSRERSGAYSHYMFLADGTGEKQFLFEKRNRFGEATDAFIIFTAGIGNGTYHSIRGLAYRMYAVIQESNKLRCSLLDGMRLAMTTMVQPEDGESIDDMTIIVNGVTSYLPPDAKLVERGTIPDLASQVMPVIRDLSQLLASTTGTYRPIPQSTEGEAPARFQRQAEIESQSALPTSSVNVFYRSMGRFLNAVLRRLQRLDPEVLSITGEHPEILAFFSRLVAKGVPVEAIKSMQKLIPVKALGLGSASQRLAAVTGLQQIAGSFDEVGRRTFERMMAAGYVGHDQVDALLPRNTKPRSTYDHKIAELEHPALRERAVEIDSSEMQAIHVGVHIRIMQEDFAGIAEKVNSMQGAPEELTRDIMYLQRALNHVSAHIDQLRNDAGRDAETAQYDDFLAQFSAAWKRMADQVQSAIQDKQTDGAAPGSEVSSDAQGKMEKHQQELQFAQESHQQKFQQKELDFQQRQRLRSIQTDQRLKAQIQTHALKTYGPAAVKV